MDEIRILLVDDDPDDLEIFLMQVERIAMNIVCKTAGNGFDALAMLDSGTNPFEPNFIFLDINMPKMNGIQCLERMRDAGLCPQAGIFLYSTTSERQPLESRYKDVGHIVKPVDPDVLKEIIENILKGAYI